MLFALGTTAAVAQKFGHIDSTTLLQEMPETIAANKQIENETKAIEDEISKMRATYEAKVAEFEQLPASTPESVRRNRVQEITGLEQQLQQFAYGSEQSLSATQQKLYQPIIDKVKTAIEEIGAENGFTYIFDTTSGAVVYEGGEDVAPLVKAKLGL